MIDTIPNPDANLAQFLAARARHASDGRLAIDAIAGVAVMTAAEIWRGPGWLVVLSVATCFFAYGLWGIADRELAERTDAHAAAARALRVGRVIAAILGFVAAAFAALALLGIALGTIKS